MSRDLSECARDAGDDTPHARKLALYAAILNRMIDELSEPQPGTVS